jgi:hypothetical protein
MTLWKITLVAVFLCFLGISSSAKECTVRGHAEWTVMIFMNGDNDLEPDALINFGQIAKIGSTDQVNLVIQFDRIGKYASTKPDWSNTLRFRVKKGMEPLPRYACEDIGEANMGDGKVLADFVNWAKTKFPAKKYMLIIWDHGQGWRLMLDQLLARSKVFMKSHGKSSHSASLFQHHLAKYTKKRKSKVVINGHFVSSANTPGAPYRSASNDETNNDVLFNREIQDSLTQLLRGEKLDIIGFDACLMSMVETGYAMRNIGNIMIGSEELEPGLGWPYDSWLALLVETPTSSAAEVAAGLVRSYGDFYSNPDNRDKNFTTTLSAVDLSQVAGLVDSLDALSDQLLALVAANKVQPLIDARRGVVAYAPGKSYFDIDIGYFLERLLSNDFPKEVKAAAQRSNQLLHSMIKANYAGSERQGPPYGSNGLAIYFPRSFGEYRSDPFADGGYEKCADSKNCKYPVEFVQSHKWTDFLHEFWKKVP